MTQQETDKIYDELTTIELKIWGIKINFRMIINKIEHQIRELEVLERKTESNRSEYRKY